MNWLDLPLPLRRRSGPKPDTFDAVVMGHETDPVIGLDCGDPFVELGMLRFLSALVQATYPPTDADEALEWHRRPPGREAFREALERHRTAFEFLATETPFFQVRPKAAEAPERRPICSLLPQVPTAEAIRGQRTAFAADPRVGRIALCLIPGLFVADEELFPSTGGGYFGVPHGADSVKFLVAGPTLWTTLLANLLPQEHPEVAAGPWPAPCAPEVWPWLDRRLAHLGTGRISPGKRAKLIKEGRKDVPETVITVDAGQRHPVALAMPRRYLLGDISEGRCDLSGLLGPSVAEFARFPQGLQYQPRGWRHPMVAMRRSWKDGIEEEPSFVKAKGPLRFDDWIEAAYGDEREPPGQAKVFSCVRPAPVVLAMRTLAGRLIPGEDDRGAGPTTSRAFGSAPYRLRLACQYFQGKAVAGMSLREVPLYRTGGPEMDLSTLASDMVEIARKAAKALESAAKAVTKGSVKEGAGRLPVELHDALLRGLEPDVLEILASVGAGGDAGGTAADARIAKRAAKVALALFDATFPIRTATATAQRIAVQRGALQRALRKLAGRGAARRSGEADRGRPVEREETR